MTNFECIVHQEHRARLYSDEARFEVRSERKPSLFLWVTGAVLISILLVSGCTSAFAKDLGKSAFEVLTDEKGFMPETDPGKRFVQGYEPKYGNPMNRLPTQQRERSLEFQRQMIRGSSFGPMAIQY